MKKRFIRHDVAMKIKKRTRSVLPDSVCHGSVLFFVDNSVDRHFVGWKITANCLRAGPSVRQHSIRFISARWAFRLLVKIKSRNADKGVKQSLEG